MNKASCFYCLRYSWIVKRSLGSCFPGEPYSFYGEFKMEAGMVVQVSFQLLMPRTEPEAFGLCSSLLAAGDTTCPIGGQARFPLRKNGRLGRSCPLPGLAVHCALSHICCVSLWKECLPYIIPHCWEPIEISQTLANNYACLHSLIRRRKPERCLWFCGPKSVKTASLW